VADAPASAADDEWQGSRYHFDYDPKVQKDMAQTRGMETGRVRG
jgi:hypothetical protein